MIYREVQVDKSCGYKAGKYKNDRTPVSKNWKGPVKVQSVRHFNWTRRLLANPDAEPINPA